MTSKPKYPERLFIPTDVLDQYHEKIGLPAFDVVCVGDPHEVYVHEAMLHAAVVAERERCEEAIRQIEPLWVNHEDPEDTIESMKVRMLVRMRDGSSSQRRCLTRKS